MNSPLEILAQKGFELPPPPTSGGNYLPWVRSGDIMYLAGVISKEGDKVITGRLGETMALEDGYAAARACALIQLATIQAALGDLALVDRLLTLTGYVRCTPEFADFPKVINGASDLLVEVFGEAGSHARAAIGVSSLPAAAAVEIQLTLRVKSS